MANDEALRRLLVSSDERDRWERRLAALEQRALAAENRAGVMAGDYARGFRDGAMARKRAEHEIVDGLRLEVARWGPGGREHFADPRPGDYPGGTWPVPVPARVWVGGPVVHYHACTRACRSYRPGWYAPADAARILASLPGDYAEAVRKLLAQAAEQVVSA